MALPSLKGCVGTSRASLSLAPLSSLPAVLPHPVRRGLPGAGIADPWALSMLRRERAVGRKETSSESLRPNARRKCWEFTPAWEYACVSVYHRVNASRDGCLCVCMASMPMCGFLRVCACANLCVNLELCVSPWGSSMSVSRYLSVRFC